MNWKLIVVLIVAGMLAIRGFMADGVFGGLWLTGMLLIGFGLGKLLSKIAQRR